MMKGSAELRLDLAREPHYDDLPAEQVRLFRDDSGRIRLEVKDDRTYLDVKVVRAFPFSDKKHFFGFLDGRNKLIGVVKEPAELDPDSERLAEEALKRHYFIPTIQEVLSLKEEYGAVYVDAVTDYGTRHFVAKGLRDAIVNLGGGELLIADVDGNRYRIENWHNLNLQSRRFLERVV